jgi:hypothetical protein
MIDATCLVRSDATTPLGKQINLPSSSDCRQLSCCPIDLQIFFFVFFFWHCTTLPVPSFLPLPLALVSHIEISLNNMNGRIEGKTHGGMFVQQPASVVRYVSDRTHKRREQRVLDDEGSATDGWVSPAWRGGAHPSATAAVESRGGRGSWPK